MNRTRTSKNAKRLLVWILTLTMVFSLLPMAAFADETVVEPVVSEEPVQETEPSSEPTEEPSPEPEEPAEEDPADEPSDEEPTDEEPVDEEEEVVVARYTGNDGFLRIFHLDCGRKYFSVSEIKGIIDQLAENHYTHIQLAFGNDGFRFLLDDMKVTLADGTEYIDSKVRTAITNGNSSYSKSNNTADSMLSESDMDAIISYANSKGIKVIPMLNTPGHMHALVSAMNELGIRSSTGSEMNLSSDAEVEFIEALQQNYITYFANRGCDHYNLAADEYSFSSLSNDEYTAFAKYVNAVALMVKKAGMTPMAYNDGIYYSGKTTTESFDKDIQICYWAQNSNYASAAELSELGFAIINNNDAWYYVLGDYLYEKWAQGQWGYKDALNGIQNTKVTEVKNDSAGAVTPVGSVLCCWCDGPSVSYTGTRVSQGTAPSSQTNQQSVYALIKAMAEANPDYFRGSVSTEPELEVDNSTYTTVEPVKQSDGSYKVTAKADDTVKLKVTNIDEATALSWTTGNAEVAVVDNGVVTFTGVAGTVIITASIGDGSTVLTATFVVPEDTGEEYETVKDIYLSTGETQTVTIEDKNLTVDGKTYKTEDESVATVAVEGKDATESSIVYEQYTSGVTYYDLANGNSNSTITSYFYYNEADENYYPVYAYRVSRGMRGYTYHYGIIIDDIYTDIATSNYGNVTIRTLYRQTRTEGTSASTTLTFTGRAVGDTYVIIDGVKYNIHVSREDTTGAADLPIQLWITNSPVVVDNITTKTSSTWSASTYAYYVSAKAGTANVEQGVALSELVPPAVKDNAETTSDDRDAKYILWKGTVLNTTTGLQGCWSKDMTLASGRTDYQYVRYFGGKWAVSADRVNWTTVTGTGSTGTSSSCTEQVIAYYMQRTSVTKEVITDVVDWGNTTDKWSENNPTQYGVLDFAVQYPDHRSPNKFPQDGKTMYFHCNEADTNGVVIKDSTSGVYYRRIGAIKGIDTTNYEVYMITVTPTSDTASEQLTNSSTALTTDITIEYNGTEKVAWVDDEANLPANFRGDDVKFHSISGSFNYTVGGEPNIEGLEIYQRHGMLVTYYLRAKVTADTLYVHYVDKVANKEFYSYPINVIAEATQGFKEGIGLGDPWKGPLVNGDVKNDEGVTQTVNADLSTMPAIGAQYRFGNYTCVEVTCDGDRKDVYLYYVFTPEKTFVVDFGLTLNIKPTDVSSELANANITGVQYDKSYYATITDGADYSINYTLNKTIDGVDNFQVVYKGINLDTKEDGTATFTISIIPASNVYYEDSLVTFTPGSYGDNNTPINWTKVYDDENNPVEKNATQELSELGSGDIYGFDAAYKDSAMFSMGSAQKVTVTSEMGKATWPTATFTFKGTGFDIISLTDNKAGAILVSVYDSDGKLKTGRVVDNYYGYNYVDEAWVVDKTDGNNALYQIPVIKVSGLDWGDYKVVVTAFYDEVTDHADSGSCTFYFDAFRVYDPLDPDKETTGENYRKDGEGYPKYIKLHDAVTKSDIKTTLFIDGKEEATVTEYTNFGPNNEVYLANGQAISFKITGDNIDKIQIGAKAPSGTAELEVNSAVIASLSTATEMYYDISTQAKGNLVTITNTTGNILSLTNIKVTFTSKSDASLAVLSADDEAQAVAMVRALFAPPVVETFVPDRFEASWSSNVREGSRAVLTVKTSEDVEAIMVNGETVINYRTRTERTGWGWNAKRVTYREFTYMVSNAQNADYTVIAVNADGVQSEPIVAALSVKPARPTRPGWGWLDDLLGRWF